MQSFVHYHDALSTPSITSVNSDNLQSPTYSPLPSPKFPTFQFGTTDHIEVRYANMEKDETKDEAIPFFSTRYLSEPVKAHLRRIQQAHTANIRKTLFSIFGHICLYMPKYAQIQQILFAAYLSKYRKSPFKSVHICRYLSIYANIYLLASEFVHMCLYLSIYTDILSTYADIYSFMKIFGTFFPDFAKGLSY